MKGWVSSASYKAAVQTIVSARLAAGLSQAALAEKIGQYPSFIAKVELVERRLDFVEFVAVARALKMKPEDLMAQVAEAVGEAIEI